MILHKVEDSLPNSVHPRLKDCSDFILLYTKENERPYIGYYNYKTSKFYIEGYSQDNPTHWSYLPVPDKLDREQRLIEYMAKFFIFNINKRVKWLTALGIPTNYGYPKRPKILGSYV